MRKVALFAVICVACFGMTAMAQQNALTSALDSPIKMEAESYNAGEVIVCSLALPASAALFGTDHSGGVFITDELFSPFRSFTFDENCSPISTWSSSGVVGTTTTGIGFPNAGAGTYWLCDPFGGATVTEYTSVTGVATGTVLATPAGGSVWGSLVVDNNQAGEIMCLNEIALDATTCIDAAAGGAFVCLYANADNTGGGAFGNGTSDAVAPGDCSGQTLLNASGTIGEGQVTRLGQYDCSGADPGCSDRWTVGNFSTFVNGIAEFTAGGGARDVMIADNVTSVMLHLSQPVGISDCQDTEADMDLVYANASQGGGDFNVDVDTTATLSVGIQKTAAGNGKFVHHMNAGAPSSATVTVLFGLGDSCFSYLGGSPVVVENNVGKTNLVGSSAYFGTPIANPAKAPSFLGSLLQASIDTTNLPAGAVFTHQLIALNGAAASKGGSLSNALTTTMQ